MPSIIVHIAPVGNELADGGWSWTGHIKRQKGSETKSFLIAKPIL